MRGSKAVTRAGGGFGLLAIDELSRVAARSRYRVTALRPPAPPGAAKGA